MIQSTAWLWGIVAICVTIICTAVTATWKIGTRFSRIEARMEGHMNYHQGFDDAMKGIVADSLRRER